MKVILLQRGGGKTARAIRMCHEDGLHMVCINKPEALRALMLAAEMGPMVEPGFMSERVMNFWQGTPASEQRRRKRASHSASVA